MIPYKGKYKVTQIYKGADHQGVDLVGLSSKNIYAPVSGQVAAARYDTYPDGGMGLYVKILSDDGLWHLLGHMDGIFVSAGDYVDEGDKIGIEGNSGHSFGSHCHYEIRKNQNAYSYIDVCQFMNIPNALGTYITSNKDLVQIKYNFNEATMIYLNKYEYAEELFKIMLKYSGEQRYQLNTINYILGYQYGVQVFQKLSGI